MKIKLKECVQLVKDRTSIENVDLASYISTDNMLPNRKGVDFNKSSKPKAKTVLMYQKGDVLISNIRPYFKKIWMADRNGTRSGDILAFRVNKSGILQKYLYCILQSDIFFDYVMASAKGTKMPRGDKNAILDFEFEVPSIEKQKKVYKPILTIEKKINLNNKINTNLLELGLELISNINFKNYLPLNKIVEVKDGTHSSPASTLNGYPLVTSKAIKGTYLDFSQTKNISEADFTEINKRSLVEYHDILISMIGTVGIVHLVTENPVKYAIKNVGLIKSSEKNILSPFLYLYLLSDYGQTYIKEHLSGSTQQFISLTSLRKMPIPISSNIPAKLIEKLNAIVLKIEHNSNENNILNSIKNVLLEKYF